MARGAVPCSPAGPYVARLQTWHRESHGRAAARTWCSTGVRGSWGGCLAHGGAGVQALGAGQLPAEALQDLQRVRAVRRLDVAGERAPAERARGVLAVPEPRAVRAGQPAAERRRAGGPGLGSAIAPEAPQDLEPLHRPRAARHPQRVREDHQERVEGNAVSKLQHEWSSIRSF